MLFLIFLNEIMHLLLIFDAICAHDSSGLILNYLLIFAPIIIIIMVIKVTFVRVDQDLITILIFTIVILNNVLLIININRSLLILISILLITLIMVVLIN